MNIVDEAFKSLTERSLIDLSYRNVVIASKNVSVNLLTFLMYMLILTILFSHHLRTSNHCLLQKQSHLPVHIYFSVDQNHIV
jgi:hypothetical protein